MKFFSLKIFHKTGLKWGMYNPQQKLAVGANFQPDGCRSTGPVDRQRSKIRPLEPRSTGPVDRCLEQRAELSAGRPTRSTDPVDRGFSESRALWTVDRPSSQTWRARLCTSVDRLGRPTPSAVDRPGRQAAARTGLISGLKC